MVRGGHVAWVLQLGAAIAAATLDSAVLMLVPGARLRLIDHGSSYVFACLASQEVSADDAAAASIQQYSSTSSIDSSVESIINAVRSTPVTADRAAHHLIPVPKGKQQAASLLLTRDLRSKSARAWRAEETSYMSLPARAESSRLRAAAAADKGWLCL